MTGWRERQAAGRAAEDESRWGMVYAPDPDNRGPVELAQEAHARGDRLFQVDIPISWIQGVTAVEQAATRVMRAERTDVLGAIEDVGWRLEHMSSVFVQNGSSAVDNGVGVYRKVTTAVNGTVIGTYVFRREVR